MPPVPPVINATLLARRIVFFFSVSGVRHSSVSSNAFAVRDSRCASFARSDETD
jgi:hypothetical protein